MLSLLAELKDQNYISELNYQFAKLIDSKQQNEHYSEQQRNLAILLSALVSYNVMQGHSCILLNSALTQMPFGLNSKQSERDFHSAILQKIGHLSPLEWQQTLQNHIAFSDSPEKIAPMLFQNGRLYFYRYWQAEHCLAAYLQRAASFEKKNANAEQDKAILNRFFTPAAHIDWQKVAVATALNRSFCLISGGPGTGKTRTVAILLAALQLKQLENGLPPLKIALAAPTGKAAARLKESISQNLDSLALPESLKQQVPTNASTIHSLIGIRPNSDIPTHHSKNPLHLDLLVVDETSMVDLFVMEKLFNALKPTTRLIMLGDKDQLASVEAGNMMSELGDLISLGYSHAHSDYLSQSTGYPIVSQNGTPPAICDSLCHLRISYRFNEHSGVGQLAAYINAKQAVDSWQIFANSAMNDLTLHTYPAVSDFSEKRLWVQYCVNVVVTQAVSLYRDYLELVKQRASLPSSVSVERIFDTFNKVRLLSALRVSELGVENLNQMIAEALRQAHLVQFKQSRENYIGKPILITENSPQNSVFSGDIGILLPDEQGNLRVYFDTVIGEVGEGIEDKHYLNISPSRLPSYEPAYVMTVHKSQGSEFEHTLLVMPLNTAPVLTKELLYTAVTRAKKRFTLFADERTWKQAVKTEVQRQSGLKALLLNA